MEALCATRKTRQEMRQDQEDLERERRRKDRRKNSRRAIVLIDFENIDYILKDENVKLNFSKLMMALLEVGKIDFAFVFIPAFQFDNISADLENLGFDIVVCPKVEFEKKSQKKEDTVDAHMAIMGKSFLAYSEITDVILLTHDKHSLDLSAEVVKAGKRLTYFAIKEKMGNDLRKFVDAYSVQVLSLPVEERSSLDQIGKYLK